ncbi:MAG: RpiB/LacA/LacB family sugar-phosphate isomerase [Puniceicoccales bacterium]|jgi:ribose 5-phosphate isomerase B|nr:RpiB/LacA/LacB family sugar-phosphate isomerase [Puniceicoccales bacterium]
MIISLGLDQHAVHLKGVIVKYIEGYGFEVLDRCVGDDTQVDYTDIARKVAKDIRTMQANFGVLMCYTGNGMAIAANKFQGIRAALVHTSENTMLARAHIDANVMCVGSAYITSEKLRELIDIFFRTEFSSSEHERELSKIVQIEFGQFMTKL